MQEIEEPAPAATPFDLKSAWPAPGYQPQDFPRTESLIHRFVVLPVGVDHTVEDVDYMADVVRHLHGALGLSR